MFAAKGEETLMELYAKTGRAKIEAIKEYISGILRTTPKFLVFGHHHDVLDAIEAHLKDEVSRGKP